MPKNQEVAFGEDTIFLSNGYPVSYRSSKPVGPADIRKLEKNIGDFLGHPVVFMDLRPEHRGDAWEGRLFHPDSVLIESGYFQDTHDAPRDGEVVCLWNGEDVSELHRALVKAGIASSDVPSLADNRGSMIALRSQRLGKKELSGKFRFSDSARIMYFRDKAGRGLVPIGDSTLYAYCPGTPELISLFDFLNFQMGISNLQRAKTEIEDKGCKLILDESILEVLA